MIKLTKRKGFNFFRSYYDVFNELPEKDKLPFIEALFDRQFLGIEPTNLTGMAKFAWISQVNSIDSQVKGYNDKAQALGYPTLGGAHGGADTPCQQVEEEVEEEVEDLKIESIDFNGLLKLIKLSTKRNFRTINQKTKNKYKARLKEGYTKEDIKMAIKNACLSDYHKETNFNYLTPEFFSRADILDKYTDTTNIIEKPKFEPYG